MKEIMPSYLFELLNLVVNKLDVEVKWLLTQIFNEIPRTFYIFGFVSTFQHLVKENGRNWNLRPDKYKDNIAIQTLGAK